MFDDDEIDFDGLNTLLSNIEAGDAIISSFSERFSLEDPCSNLLCGNETNEQCEECSHLPEWSRVK